MRIGWGGCASRLSGMGQRIGGESADHMLARVAIVAAAGGTAELTYAIPAALEGRVEPGHRVLVPIRSRRGTGIGVATGQNTERRGATPAPPTQRRQSPAALCPRPPPASD